MKLKLIHILSLLAVTILLSACFGDADPKIPSLAETYSKKDKRPFGTDIAFRQLEAMYPSQVIREKKLDFKKTWQGISDTGALYVCIAQKLFVDDDEAEAMMDFVHAGNSLFISATVIDDILLDKIGSNMVSTDPMMERALGIMLQTGVHAAAEPGSAYAYYYYPFQNYFITVDSSNTRVLGYNDMHKPNLIVHFYGRGKLYLQCEPRAYSNYFLLTGNNYQYLKNSVAYTQTFPEHIYWDDHYNKINNRRNTDRSFSTFSEIMKHPPLKFAFWIAVCLMLLYILFNGKRLQRIIPQLKPNENTTVTFTETIGRLYLQKKDNKNIADKMITYFNEYIRNTYFLNTNHVNADFIAVLGRKSGVDRDRVETLYRTIVATQNSDVVNDYQLLSLHEQIQQFYTRKGKQT